MDKKINKIINNNKTHNVNNKTTLLISLLNEKQATSPLENQPQSKMANLNNTRSDEWVNYTNVCPCDSTTSTYSCALHMDESNINDEYNTKEEPNVTKEILFDVSDSETDNVTVSQMQVDPDEDEATDCQHIESYSLRLPTLAQLIAQSELEQGTSSGDQTKAERIKKKENLQKLSLILP